MKPVLTKMKPYNFYKTIVFSLSFGVIGLIACCNTTRNNEIGEEEQLLNKKIQDSLTATGQHGYYTTTFIVGRLKATPVWKGLPFEVKVSKIAPELLEEKIKFHILDSASYSIAYSEDNKEDIILHGFFDKKLENEKIQIVISKADLLSDSTKPSIIESLKMLDYLFKVHTY